MSKNKNIILIIICMIFALPVFSIENNMQESQSFSTNFTEMADFTGERFFRSGNDLQKERTEEIAKENREYNRQFLPSKTFKYQYSNKKTIAPVKKLRLKTARYFENKAKLKAEKKKSVDANGMFDASDEENSVEAEEKELVKNKIIMKSKVMKYLPESNDIEATGNLSITFPEQNTVIYGKRMTYNNLTNIIQIFDDVKIVRPGSEILGDYFKIDLNEESGLLTNVKAKTYNIDLIAENGYMFGDTLVTEKGKIKTDVDQYVIFSSEGFSQDVRNIITSLDDYKFLLNELGVSKFLVKVDHININAKDSSDVIKLKHPKIYTRNGKKIASLPSMTIYTNKEHDTFEGNYPELGSIAAMGMFAGPGVVFEMPHGSTLKILPTLNYKSKFGFGGIARFSSGTNLTNFAYNTAANKFYLKGEQRLDDYLTLQYNANSYMDGWFLGQEWIGYGGQLVYERGFIHSDFMKPGSNLSFTHRFSAGYLSENTRNADNAYTGLGDMSTTRFRYMAQLNQNLYSKFKGENRSKVNGWRLFDINLIAEGSAALYGSGDTQFIGRIGPNISTQYKFWRQDIGYYLSAYEDNTPMITLDAYRYGKSNLYIREYLRLCKYLTLGFYGSYSFDDGLYDYQQNSDSKIKEASFYVALGPDDFKLNLGYDFIRENTYFGFSVAMNPKGTVVDYNKMTIKNPDEFGKVKGEQNVVKNYGFVAPPSPYKSKAVVEEIEDATTVMRGENI